MKRETRCSGEHKIVFTYKKTEGYISAGVQVLEIQRSGLGTHGCATVPGFRRECRAPWRRGTLHRGQVFTQLLQPYWHRTERWAVRNAYANSATLHVSNDAAVEACYHRIV